MTSGFLDHRILLLEAHLWVVTAWLVCYGCPRPSEPCRLPGSSRVLDADSLGLVITVGYELTWNDLSYISHDPASRRRGIGKGTRKCTAILSPLLSTVPKPTWHLTHRFPSFTYFDPKTRSGLLVAPVSFWLANVAKSVSLRPGS